MVASGGEGKHGGGERKDVKAQWREGKREKGEGNGDDGISGLRMVGCRAGEMVSWVDVFPVCEGTGMRSFNLICGLALAIGLSGVALAEGEKALPVPGKSVSIEVLIANFSTAANAEKGVPTAEQILELEKQGNLASSTRVQLATLDMQTAKVQYGENVPVPTGATVQGGRPAISYRMVETGTIIEATPRLEDDGSVVLLLSVQETRLVPGTKAGAEKEEAGGFTPTKTAVMSAKTTLRVPAGKSVVTGGQRSDKEPNQTWIVISAKVLSAK
jgi:hypothetical protein